MANIQDLSKKSRWSWRTCHNGQVKLLLVEDDKAIADTLVEGLTAAGHTVVHVTTGAGALAERDQEMVLLDLGLPDMDGRDVCRQLRQRSRTPIIMLTARSEEFDRVLGLELGADDYVTKPFSPKTLVARIKALFRRLERKPDESPSQYRYGNLVMDLARHEVTVKKVEVPLTAKEFGLLEHLLRNPGRVLTRDVLLNTVWGYDYYGTTRTVDVHIRRLKQKLPSLNEAIVSVKSLGYKLKEE